MKHTQKILGVALVTHNQSPKVLKPRKQPLDLPASAVSAQAAPVLSLVLPVAAVRRDHFDSILSQFGIQLVRVVGIVADQILGSLRDGRSRSVRSRQASPREATHFQCKGRQVDRGCLPQP